MKITMIFKDFEGAGGDKSDIEIQENSADKSQIN